MTVERKRDRVRREVAAERLGNFYERFGQPDFPTVDFNERLAFVEVEDRVAAALPYASGNVREFIAENLNGHNKPLDLPALDFFLYMGAFSHTLEGLVQRAEALVAAYYGTLASEEEITLGFSLKSKGAVLNNIRWYFETFRKVNSLYSDSIYGHSIRKLPESEIFSPRERLEEIKRDNDLWVYLERRYIPEVEEIEQHLAAGEFVILDAPFGTGKTYLIANNLFRRRRALDYSPEMEDAQVFTPRHLLEYTLPDLLKREKRLLIIDEMPSMVLPEIPNLGRFMPEVSTEDIQILLRTLHEQRVETLFINATRTQELRDEATRILMENGERYGIRFTTHVLKTRYIPEDLARKGLEYNNADEELTDFVLDPENKALLTPTLYTIVRGCSTLAQLREVLDRGMISGSFFPGFLQAGLGGSKEDTVRALINAGVIPSPDSVADIPDYN